MWVIDGRTKKEYSLSLMVRMTEQYLLVHYRVNFRDSVIENEELIFSDFAIWVFCSFVTSEEELI